MTRRNHSESGMSLIQVIIAMAVTILIGTFVMQMLFQMKKVEMLMSMNSEVADTELAVQRVLMTPLGCINTLYSKLPISDKSFPVALDGIYGDVPFNYTAGAKNTPVIATGQIVGSGKINLAQIRLIKEKPGDPAKTLIKGGVDKVFLELQFGKNIGDNAKLGGDFIIRRLPISVQTDSDGNVKGCTSLDQVDIMQQLCSDLEGNFDQTTKACDLHQSPQVVKAICDALGLSVAGMKCK